MARRAAAKAAHDIAPRLDATRGTAPDYGIEALLALTTLKMLGRRAILWAVLSLAAADDAWAQGFT